MKNNKQQKNIPISTKFLAGKPKLRFPGFDGEWEEMRLMHAANFTK